MISFKDRIATPSNQYKLTPTGEDGVYLIEFSPDSLTDAGTPINRLNLMAIQGFHGRSIVFNDDGSLVETNEYGDTLHTTFGYNGSMTETFTDRYGVAITKVTIFNDDGSIEEGII